MVWPSHLVRANSIRGMLARMTFDSVQQIANIGSLGLAGYYIAMSVIYRGLHSN